MIPPKKNLAIITVVVGLILFIPFGATITNQGADGQGWHWKLLDFIVMGALLYAAGLAVDFVSRKLTKPVYKVAVIGAIVLALVFIWVELAVGGVSKAFRFIF